MRRHRDSDTAFAVRQDGVCPCKPRLSIVDHESEPCKLQGNRTKRLFTEQGREDEARNGLSNLQLYGLLMRPRGVARAFKTCSMRCTDADPLSSLGECCQDAPHLDRSTRVCTYCNSAPETSPVSVSEQVISRQADFSPCSTSGQTDALMVVLVLL